MYLFRHGETIWNVERRIQGVSPTPLNALGIEQAKALAGPLKGKSIAAIYSSHLRRARQTADILSERLGVAVREEPRLAELDQGELEGKTFAELQAEYNGLLDRWGYMPAEVRMPGGETLGELQERAWAAIETIREAHSGESVVAVSHNLTITTILCRILGVDLNRIRRIRQHNASFNVLEHTPDRGWSVVTMNNLSHLRDTPVSERNPYI